MDHQSTEMDSESLQKRERRRGTCLDVFLVVSIIFLFAAVTVVAAGGMVVMMELRSKVDSSSPAPEFLSSASTGDTPYPAYKMQNFAYLEATSSDLTNSTMRWAPVLFGRGQTVGSNFSFDPKKHTLELKQTGMYFMYIDLKLSCSSLCNSGFLSVNLGNKLTCEVELSDVLTPKSKKCWTVSHMKEDTQLLAQMTIPKQGLQNWKLELDGSGYGLFLVD